MTDRRSITRQRGGLDPQAAGTAGGGGLVAFLAVMGVHEWVAVGGLIISAITCSTYVWKARQTVKIQREQLDKGTRQ